MDAAKRIYLLSPSIEEDRPKIDFELSANRSVDWGLIDDVAFWGRRLDEYRPFNVVVPDVDACSWDFYDIPGTFGLLSDRAAAVVRPFGPKYFEFLPANPKRAFLLSLAEHRTSGLLGSGAVCPRSL